MAIKDIKRGAFWSAGNGLDKNRRVIKKRRQATVNSLLIFEEHVVVNFGSCGTVVDKHNFIEIMGGKE